MPRLLPSPISFVCGALLFALLTAFGTVAAMVAPLLIELLRTAPHLAMLGFLALVVSPGVAITVAHHVGAGKLDALEKLTASRRRGALPDLESWAAGAHGWLVMYGTSVLTNLVLLVLDPPKLEPESFGIMRLVSGLVVTHVMSAPSLVWVLIATMFFELQRRARA